MARVAHKSPMCRSCQWRLPVAAHPRLPLLSPGCITFPPDFASDPHSTGWLRSIPGALSARGVPRAGPTIVPRNAITRNEVMELPVPRYNRRSLRDGCVAVFLRRHVSVVCVRALIFAMLAGPESRLVSQQSDPQPTVPDSPQPQASAVHPATPAPCPAKASTSSPAPASNADGAKSPAESAASPSPLSTRSTNPPCPPPPNWYVRFTNGPQVKPLTPREKAWLATRNVVDPFNVITILGDSAIDIGSNSDSPYGPGMPG